MTNILAIESSCDETAVAVYNQQHGLIAHGIHSQILLHREYGGVVPELASRNHLTKIIPLTKHCLKKAHLSLIDIDVFAYTQGPGLAGALLVGASAAHSFAFALNKPTLAIHHLEGHILSPLLDKDSSLDFPFLCLLVSGGNTQLILAEDIGEYKILGETLDDSAGEAFDKTAKLLGMPYPGGPEVSKLAQYGKDIYNFPRPMKYSDCLDFSFSGLKTSVLTQVQRMGGVENLSDQDKANICASFVNAVIDVLSYKSLKALKYIQQEYHLTNNTTDNSNIKLVIAGGVSANLQLREQLNNMCQINNYAIYYPSLQWCTDNAAMIALAASLKIQQNADILNQPQANNCSFEVKPRWNLI